MLAQMLGVNSAALVVFAVIVLYPISIVAIARQQRGLELMVHDASHQAWHHKSKVLNNLIANLVVAYPMLMTVEAYWKFHCVHHARYGSELDPCRQRFARIGLGHLDLSTRWKIARAVIRWLPGYNIEYYKEIGSRSMLTWRNLVIWHSAAFVVPTAIVLSFTEAGRDFQTAMYVSCGLWLIFWVVPALSALPVIRSVAESEEHDYQRGETEYGTTFTNIGRWHKLLFHPWNDEYHLIHHMFLNMPQRVQHRVHALLMEHDELYRNSLKRSSVLRG